MEGMLVLGIKRKRTAGIGLGMISTGCFLMLLIKATLLGSFAYTRMFITSEQEQMKVIYQSPKISENTDYLGIFIDEIQYLLLNYKKVQDGSIGKEKTEKKRKNLLESHVQVQEVHPQFWFLDAEFEAWYKTGYPKAKNAWNKARSVHLFL